MQVEDYRNSSMIECKMGISADTLVLIHSSTKVRNEKQPLMDCVITEIEYMYLVFCDVLFPSRKSYLAFQLSP